MNWDGRIGPAAILAFGLAVLQGLSFYTDGKAEMRERLVKIETQFNGLSGRVEEMMREFRRADRRGDVPPAGAVTIVPPAHGANGG